MLMGSSLLPFPVIIPAAAPAAQGGPAMELTLWELLIEGGWVMIPLYAVSFVVVALIIYYFMTLRAGRIVTDDFRKTMETVIQEKNFGAMLERSRDEPQILARVMERTASFLQRNPSADFAAVREVAQTEGSRQASALHQQTVYLMDMGVLAPMLGLFGTVVGILRSFGRLASEDIPMRTMLLAGGVSQALVATAVGLLVGISAMFFYSYFRGRVQGLISELEASATALVAQLGVTLKK